MNVRVRCGEVSFQPACTYLCKTSYYAFCLTTEDLAAFFYGRGAVAFPLHWKLSTPLCCDQLRILTRKKFIENMKYYTYPYQQLNR